MGTEATSADGKREVAGTFLSWFHIQAPPAMHNHCCFITGGKGEVQAGAAEGIKVPIMWLLRGEVLVQDTTFLLVPALQEGG